ncbi:hypothetical protein PENSTE_c009G03666 [Penicillium steckii]|uniref:Cytochrome P450 n=1 Tax=Penicillium steckii TaxID=303698 RepID=A0A1V6TBP1_9EURO|nr:hypothetical protein PENSTE_c009G03666 [Penicillium steckii]
MFGGYVSKILESTSPPYGLLLLALGTVFIAQIVRTLAWRLWLHPLASIPGPRLAAVSGLWQMRQDLFLENSARAIDQLHREYNTDIVRISPNHVHINDPDFFFKIFSIGSGFDKDPSFYGRLGVPRSILSADSRSARAMRSKANAIVAPRDWGVMAEKAYLATRLASDELAILSKKGEEIDFFQMLRSISTDILCQLSYGFSPGFVDKPEEAKKLFDVLDMCLESLWFRKNSEMVRTFGTQTIDHYLPVVHMPFLSEYLFSLPKWLLKILLPAFTYFRNLGGGWIDQTLENSKNAHPNDKKTTVMDALNPSKDHILTEADREWLIDQGNTFLFAGVDTTSTMLMFTFHKVLSSPGIHGRLKEELRNANLSIEEKYDWRRVRQLPYLTAVIKEGLRLSLVIPGRLPRLVPADGIEFNGIFLPGGGNKDFGIQHDLLDAS